ncbi:MAG: N-acetyltransferase [Comamonadaceae bacterium]|nr:MAG: N-acetyltransferase [Comamonadaceae bacterium]
MRIDVVLDHRDLDDELAKLHRRMHTPGDALHGMPTIPVALPGLVVRYREVAGEFYLYVEDVARRALAGCTVFNHAPDVGRAAERHLRSPHSRYGAAYRRRGIASAVYTWALQAGLCLVTGPRQSAAAYCLWQSLARGHELLVVQLNDGGLHCLGTQVDDAAFGAFATRMVLLGAGWDRERLAAAEGFPLPPG